MKKKIFIVMLLFLFILSSCSRNPNMDTRNKQFYQGTEGIRMRIDPGAPPPRLYYYGDAPVDDYNAFSFDLELSNVGTSWTKGGIYISGFDPTLIHMDDISIPKTGGGFFDNCRFDFDLSSYGSLSEIRLDNIWDNMGGVFRCNFGDSDVEVGADPSTNAFIDSLRANNLGSGLAERFGWDWMPEIDLGFDRATDSINFGLDFSKLFGIDVDLLHHGRSLLFLLDGITFDRFNGKAFFLAPDDYNYPGGESTIISFPGHIMKSWPAGMDKTEVTFLATSCYLYSTYATPVVCVDPAPFSLDEKACYPGQVDLKGSQGAPVAVSRVTQENTPNSIIFTIEVRNVGNGDVIYPGHMELCSPYYPGRLGIQSLDTVILGDIRMSGSTQLLRCTPNDNIIRLRDGRGDITCTYNLEYTTARSAYKAPLVIELWYGYSETQRRSVTIKRVS